MQHYLRDQIDWPQAFPAEEYATRLERLRTVLRSAGLDAIYVTVPADLAWLAESFWTTLERGDVFLQEHTELGLSTYDTHSDGSGVRYASRLRPVLNIAPRTPLWGFNADTYILGWLEAEGIRYDVITDEDLHARWLTDRRAGAGNSRWLHPPPATELAGGGDANQWAVGVSTARETRSIEAR